MKQLIIFMAFAALLVGCQNSQRQFCEDSAKKMCSMCQSCGGDFKLCGLNKTTTRDDCIEKLTRVCSAYDAVYTPESGRACLSSLSSLTCDQLKSEGRPDACMRLY